MRLVFSILVGLGLATGVAVADPVSGQVARAELFDTSGIGLQLARGLSEKEQSTIKTLIPLIEQQTGTKAKFYGALAYAPDEGLISEALQGAFNFHSVEAADTAALSACRVAKQAGSGDCRLAARILPPGYQSRAISLSHDATQEFFGRYVSERGAKYFAVSQSTGAWAWAASESGALRTCLKDALGAGDCTIIVKD